MDKNKQQKLITEYNANIELWKHDDDLRQKRNGNFLSVNTILFVGLGVITSLEITLDDILPVAFFFSIFGWLICFVWNRVQNRNAEYVRFRRYQLKQIEAHLKDLSTITNIFEAFYNHQPIEFPNIKERFKIAKNARKRSTLSEGNLPKIIGGLWVLILIVTSIMKLTNFFS